MNWILPSIMAAFVGGMYLLKMNSQISPQDAKDHLKAGALVIDVRSPAEFSSGHLPDAMNFPLEQIETSLPSHLKDKNQVLLLHCQGGSRSAMAKKKLDLLGYSNVFNLGSYGRAAEIVVGN